MARHKINFREIVDLIWFGVPVAVNLAIGLFPRPSAVGSNITPLSLKRTAQAALPFLATSAFGLGMTGTSLSYRASSSTC
jgi:TRAP-type C4-dicarboxylate transport system permease large subunit